MKAAWEAALDTSAGAALALMQGGTVVSNECLREQGRNSDRTLVPWVQRQLDQAGVGLADIRNWTVGTGPGSFAGLRVGIALVQGLAAPCGARVRGVPSSVALARSGGAGRTMVLHDARRGQLIATRFDISSEEVREHAPPAVLEPRSLTALCDEVDSIVTPHGDAVRDLVPPHLHHRLRCVPGVDAALLLNVPGWPCPTSPRELKSSCGPVYVRPAVFVKPKRPRRSIG